VRYDQRRIFARHSYWQVSPVMTGIAGVAGKAVDVGGDLLRFAATGL